MGNGNQHDEPNRRSMEQQYHPRILTGVLGSGSAVCIRYDDTLAAEQVEAVVSLALCLNAAVGNAARSSNGSIHRLSVYHCRHATVHLFPILIGRLRFALSDRFAERPLTLTDRTFALQD